MVSATKPPHQWNITNNGGEHESAKRSCLACLLVDDRSVPDGSWRHEDTICIEPVPAAVTYDMLMAEVRASETHAKHQPRMYGYPGSLCIGFRKEGRNGAELNPCIQMTKGHDPNETGWGWLLRYVRLQLANPGKSGFTLVGQGRLELSPKSNDDCRGGCCDDH